jgi:anion-transporting  ArsA/GET3 family ATPase
MSSLYDRRFVFVTGKGGVGKTTVTVALALAMAARGKRVLCAACNAKERYSTIFGTDPVGTEIAQMADNVWAVNMEPSVALGEYGLMILKSRTLYSAVFDNKYTRSFFRATPGLYEWAMLGKAWWHTTEEGADGRPRFDVVLLDAPATGHGLDMLRVPKILVELVPPGILRRDAEKAWTMFRDARQTSVVVVTLAEEMPVNETIELVGSMEGELGLHVERVVVNGLLPPLFSPDEGRALLAPGAVPVGSEAAGAGSDAGAALAAGVRRAAREQLQRDSVARLATSLLTPRLELPFLFEGAENLRTMRELVRKL